MQRRMVLLVAAGVVLLAGAVAAVAAVDGDGRTEERAGRGRSTEPAGPSPTPAEELPPPPGGVPPAPPPIPPSAEVPRPALPPALPEPPGYNPVIVSPRPGMENVQPLIWRRAEVLDERRVRIHFESGVAPCSVLDRVEVAYSPSAITVRLLEGSDPAFRDAACILIAQFKAVDVILDEPVNGRPIADGSA